MKRFQSLPALLLLLCGCTAQAEPNVLFIIVDDLRTELPIYGQDHIEAPNIDRLASEGVVFSNAYANVPVCGASRASLMTGLRPTRVRFLGYDARADEDAPGVMPLHAFLKAQGYHTESMGKVLHERKDSEDGWSVPPWSAQEAVPKERATGFRNYQSPENIAAFKKNGVGPAIEVLDVPDNAYFDGQTADRAVAALERLAKTEQPFFLAVGFVKPHLPFTAPKKYWDRYDHDAIELARVKSMPESVPDAARHSFGELRRYTEVPDDPREPVDDELARNLKHGYYASVSYADAQIGRVLDTLRALELDSSTIVLLIGDHGWSLGEHGLWAKHSPFDVATRTVAVMRAPGFDSTGTTQGLVELVDIYPTLLELLGVEPPGHLQGQSFVPLLADIAAPGKEAVFPRWKNADVVKTERYALTTWSDRQGQPIAEMMFDHEIDRDEIENVAPKGNLSLTKQELRALLAELGQEER
jgi:arylsulfatase A-like enzyme